jgi:hypothetical protein
MDDTNRSRDVSVPPHPLVLEVDTWPWLTGERCGGRPAR